MTGGDYKIRHNNSNISKSITSEFQRSRGFDNCLTLKVNMTVKVGLLCGQNIVKNYFYLWIYTSQIYEYMYVQIKKVIDIIQILHVVHDDI